MTLPPDPAGAAARRRTRTTRFIALAIVVALVVAGGAALFAAQANRGGGGQAEVNDECLLGTWEVDVAATGLAGPGVSSQGHYFLTFTPETIDTEIDLTTSIEIGADEQVAQGIAGPGTLSTSDVGTAVQSYTRQGATLTYGEVRSASGTAATTFTPQDEGEPVVDENPIGGSAAPGTTATLLCGPDTLTIVLGADQSNAYPIYLTRP